MKLQLNESTLNAYINEAVKQEINEGGWDKLASFAGKKAARAAAKKAGKTVAKKSGEAFGSLGKSKGPLAFKHNSERVQTARKALRGANSETGSKFTTGASRKVMDGGKLEYIVKKEGGEIKYLAKDGKTPLTGDQLNLAKNNFRMRSAQYKDIRKMGNLNRGIALTAVAGGVGTAIAASGSRNPDAPWNDTPAQGEPDNNQDSGFDGTFPWDNTEPQWTPKPTRKPQPQPAQEEPQQPERRSMETSQPVSTINIPTGVTGTSETLPGLKQRPESFVDSARRVMAQTAAAGLNGNTGNPKLDNWKQTNRNTRRTANAAIDTMRRDGAITRNQARQDKRTLRDTEKTIRRNAKEMQNQGQ